MAQIVAGGSELLNPRTILREQVKLALGQIVGTFGCGGSGFFTIEAAQIVGEQGQVYAVDIVKGALSSLDSKAKLQRLYNIKTIWSDLEMVGALDIPEASVDVGLLVNILFQSKRHDEILREVSRLMKPGGKLLIIDWNDVSASFGPPKSDRVNPDALRTSVPPLGFREEKYFEAGPYHFGIIFVKI